MKPFSAQHHLSFVNRLLSEKKTFTLSLGSYSFLPLLFSSIGIKNKVIFVVDKPFVKDVAYSFDVYDESVVVFFDCLWVSGVPGISNFEQQLFFLSKNRCEGAWKGVRFCVVESTLFDKPLLSDKKTFGFFVDSGKPGDFNSLLDFLKESNYLLVDRVVSSGEYVVRGGVVDVFSFSSFSPFRFSFLEDKKVSICSFDVVSGKILKKLLNVYLFPFSKGSVVSLKSKTSEEDIYVRCDKELVSVGLYRDFCAEKTEHVGELGGFDFGFYKKNIKNLSFVSSNLLGSIGCSFFDSVFVVPSGFLGSTSDQSSFLSSEKEMFVGDYYVHESFGVCVYLGVALGVGKQRDLMCLKFKDGVVKVDVGCVGCVSFVADKSKEIQIDSIGKKGAWLSKRRRFVALANTYVKELVDLYSFRMGGRGFAFRVDEGLMSLFASGFQHRLTFDQKKAVDDVVSDMVSSKPMNRLLCGDVGFGKTEVALRASFLSLLNNRSVFVLAPTTILADQLFDVFLSRFNSFGFPVFRFNRQNKKEQFLLTLQNQKNSYVVIGTKSVLSLEKEIKNCGLFVVDEEHRFGVKDKEFVFSVNKRCDVLFLSATPLPRSLQMSLSKARQFSLINSPPLLKKQTITHVYIHNLRLIKDAVSLELSRGGQVFFVDNSVVNVSSSCRVLKKLFPFASIAMLHGKRPFSEIKKTMRSFREGLIQILVSTTIIESGIDIGLVNTIIINNADFFGLSQLHQLRGRVGRSFYQSYAYFLIASSKKITPSAQSRLLSIKKNQSLGSGYRVSLDDLDIRGAGSLFGYKQSGSCLIGFGLYSKFVAAAVAGRPYSFGVFVVDRGFCEIPRSYVSQEEERIEFYFKLSRCAFVEDCDSLLSSMGLLFGPAPSSCLRLFENKKIELLSLKTPLTKIVEKNGEVCLFFNKNSCLLEKTKGGLVEICGRFGVSCLFKVGSSGLIFQYKKTVKDDYILLSLLVGYL